MRTRPLGRTGLCVSKIHLTAAARLARAIELFGGL